MAANVIPISQLDKPSYPGQSPEYNAMTGAFYYPQVPNPNTAARTAPPVGPTADQTVGTGSTNSTAASNQTGSRSLTPAGQTAYNTWLDSVTGGAAKAADTTAAAQASARASLMPMENTPGYTADEQSRMQLTPDQEQMYIGEAGQPVAGAANAARQSLMRYSDASGANNPGMNATMERIQQEQGRQAADAVIQARMGLLTQRQQAAQAIGNARMSQQQFAAQQEGTLAGQAGSNQANLTNSGTSLINNYPNVTTTSNTTGTQSGTNQTNNVNNPNLPAPAGPISSTSLMPGATPTIPKGHMGG